MGILAAVSNTFPVGGEEGGWTHDGAAAVDLCVSGAVIKCCN